MNKLQDNVAQHNATLFFAREKTIYKNKKIIKKNMKYLKLGNNIEVDL